jgi:hypothetical protein
MGNYIGKQELPIVLHLPSAVFPSQPWQLMGSGPTRQAKFGHYLSGTKDPGSLSQTEEAVEWEQV